MVDAYERLYRELIAKHAGTSAARGVHPLRAAIA
jgi:hypothetical protein